MTEGPTGGRSAAAERADLRLRHRAERFLIARAAAIKAQIDPLRAEDRSLVLRALGKGRSAGVTSRDRMHEILAGLHARAPWMAPAATAVMRNMERATTAGSAPFRTPPMVIVGGPGIGKSRWARDLAQAFAVPAIDVDIGATNGAVFTLSGTERGWGSATPGRIVRTMLTTHVVNPLVIIDEVDKIPTTVGTVRGGSLPGAAEVLKSMIEPTTGRTWTCPCLQLPVDLSRVSWIMTTNSIAGIPASLLDRCLVISIPDPTPEQLRMVATEKITGMVADPDLQRDLLALIGTFLNGRSAVGKRTSLRQVMKMTDRITAIGDRDLLN
ncbi:AAA family ATPase [Paracoccus gahaiensis]|uniref:AAA family ATPase n=1 Tax=Paracoccus gahaiensis TaxID=1706839 RepID=A0A4U0R810_9RHOB|nr:AAA family ATPase [Paracoccus gahaiensis]TJZ91125.1 AAA family ATPase [Paracoccus gahaiensis]